MTKDVSHSDYEMIKREHDELRELLGTIHRALAQRLKTVADVTQMLADFEIQLGNHFRDEEKSGLFENVAEEAPRLSISAAKLKSEHQQLLAGLRSICQRLSEDSAVDEDWWQRMAAEFHGFSVELMQHERRENELLLATYDDDIGAED